MNKKPQEPGNPAQGLKVSRLQLDLGTGAHNCVDFAVATVTRAAFACPASTPTDKVAPATPKTYSEEANVTLRASAQSNNNVLSGYWVHTTILGLLIKSILGSMRTLLGVH